MILLLGGTSESRDLAKIFRKKKYNFIVSTASKYGGDLAQEVADNVYSGILNEMTLAVFCKENNVGVIIDATHPYAQNISTLAIKMARENNFKYLRYERSGIIDLRDNPFIFFVSSYEEASTLAQNLGSKILITTGSRNLEAYQELIANKEVYVRILPDLNSLKKCLSMGILPKNIIAMQGPFTKEFNHILFKEKQIDLVITKDSGSVGGVDTKILASSSLNIPVIIINKPNFSYPQIAYDFQTVCDFIEEVKNELSN